MSFSAPRREMASDALQSAAAAGADWVAVIPYAFVDPADPRVAFDRERQFWGETAGGVAKTIEYARGSGLSVLLKPHLWVRGQGWPGEFEPRTAEQWETFLSDYREYILRFAEVADSMDVEMLSVGTEVDLVALARPEYWRALIADVRAIYGGRLTYAANWDKYARIEFWDALDLVGVDAYFPLADDPTPAVEMLVEAWEPWSDELREVARTTGKPILFAEFGYRSVDGAAGPPVGVAGGTTGAGTALERGGAGGGLRGDVPGVVEPALVRGRVRVEVVCGDAGGGVDRDGLFTAGEGGRDRHGELVRGRRERRSAPRRPAAA